VPLAELVYPLNLLIVLISLTIINTHERCDRNTSESV
jgi:hypothetical protein